MNLIEAWKVAKVGQRIERPGIGWSIIKKGSSEGGTKHYFLDALAGDMWLPESRTFDQHVLADDWEIVKEKKKIVTTIHGLGSPSSVRIPDNATVTIEWEE